jgi:hypothetical protein
MTPVRPKPLWLYAIVVLSVLLTPAALLAGGNQVMGEIRFEGKSKVEKTSGVWVDGQYVGYLKELKGNKTVLLLPGEHTISVRQNGYQDFTQRVTIRPGEKLTVHVAMLKAATGAEPTAWSTVKIDVNPPRAAVFLDGNFIGHVAEFEGLGRGLLVAPGTHNIKITLPGYRTFQTEINPLAHQKVELKTNLLKSDVPNTDPSLQSNGPEGADRVPPQPTQPQAVSPQAKTNQSLPPAVTSQRPPQAPPPQGDPDRAPPPPPDPNPQL